MIQSQIKRLDQNAGPRQSDPCKGGVHPGWGWAAPNGVEALLELISKGEDERLPSAARECLMALAAQLELVKRQILGADRRVLAWHRSSQISKRLEAIPGIGPLIATALVASIPDPGVFRSGRDLSAWIGLVPK